MRYTTCGAVIAKPFGRVDGERSASNFERRVSSKARTMTARPSIQSEFLVPVALIFLGGLMIVSAARAGSVQTVDGKLFEGDVRFNEAGAITVTPAQGPTANLELTNIVRATLSGGPYLSSGSILQNGWAVQDLGDARGFVRLDGDAFSLKVEGQSTNPTACHFVSRPMHSDGEITARVEELGGNPGARAGIMIRSRDHLTYAFLSCDPQGKIWFESRPEAERREIRSMVVATVAPPVWLRLRKQDKFVTAYVSTDGEAWQSVARDTTKLSLERTWREHEGELHLLRASFGVFAASRGKDTLCTARVAHVAMTLNGLLGEYFADANFEKLSFTRLDPQVRFDWRMGAPNGIGEGRDFSVRWTGQLVPNKTGMVRFYFEGDDRARLWIGSQEFEPAPFIKLNRRSEPPAPPARVTLVAGRPLDLRMEFADRARPASVRLNWDWSDGRPDVIGMTNFLFTFSATNSPDELASHGDNGSPAVRGVILRNGTFLAGPVTSADESAVKLSIGRRKDVPVLNSRVARIVLRPPRQRVPYQLAAGRTGAFIKNGDFFESEFRGIDRGSLLMSSVLFGVKRFGIESGDASVVILNDFETDSAASEVRLLDGSILRGRKVFASPRQLTVEEPLLGPISIPVDEVWEIRRGTIKSG